MSKTLLYIESAKSPVFAQRYERIKELGYRLVVARQDLGDNATTVARYVDDLVACSPYNLEDVDQVVETLVEYCQGHPVDGVVTRWDAGVAVMAGVSERLGFQTLPFDSAKALSTKYSMRQMFARLGLPSAKSTRVSSLNEALAAAESVGYPVVVKPTEGTASWGVIRADKPHDITNHYEQLARLAKTPFPLTDFLVEEYLPGNELSVETVVYQGEPVFTAITEKPTPMYGEGGFAEVDFLSPARYPTDVAAEIVEIVHRLIRGLRITNCVTHTELRLTPMGPRLLEVGARVGGYRIPRITQLTHGIDLEVVAYQLATGQPPELGSGWNGMNAAFRCLVPSKAGKLRAITGESAVRAVANVVGLDIAMPVGSRVAPFPYWVQDNVGFIISAADSPGACLAALGVAEAALQIDIASDDD